MFGLEREQRQTKQFILSLMQGIKARRLRCTRRITERKYIK
jgi:hypothetical protein